MRVQLAAARGIERCEVAKRLRELQGAERKGLAGNGHVLTRRGRNQDEDAGVRSSLVELTGRMEVPGSVAEHRRHPCAISNRMTKRLQLVRQLGVRPEIREQRKIIAAMHQRQDRV